jgi:N-acetylmuramic acid 6-phosphate (MurNAc-6-P) etherase
VKGRRACWARLPTEARHPRSRDSDRLATRRVVRLLLDEDREADGRRQGRRLAPEDVLVGISASSVTPFVRGATRRGPPAPCRHHSRVTCAPHASLRRCADVVGAVRTSIRARAGGIAT